MLIVPPSVTVSTMQVRKLAENYADKVECIRIFASRGGTVNDIINSIKKVFNGKRGDIMLSTVHKAKGLEADNVFILATDRMPNKRLVLKKTTFVMLRLPVQEESLLLWPQTRIN